MLRGLTGNTCPECGATIGADARDTPVEPLHESPSGQDRIRRTCLWVWLASWTVVPIFVLALAPVITNITTDEELRVTINFILMFSALMLAVISPIVFLYSLLPDRPR